MKKYTDLKELLADFSMDILDLSGKKRPNSESLADKYCEANSLALGKPEPLVKNKQTKEVKCKYCMDYKIISLHHVDNLYADTFIDCPRCTRLLFATDV